MTQSAAEELFSRSTATKLGQQKGLGIPTDHDFFTAENQKTVSLEISLATFPQQGKSYTKNIPDSSFLLCCFCCSDTPRIKRNVEYQKGQHLASANLGEQDFDTFPGDASGKEPTCQSR